MHPDLSSYRQLSDDDFKRLWNKATFAIDTSVLLNLYRYPASARDDLLRALEQIRERIFVPFHVALEYERNRHAVIAEQKKRFRDVRDVVTNKQEELRRELDALQLRKRHASIRADEFLTSLSAEVERFLARLAELERAQPDVFDRDEIRERIESLVAERVGSPPATQKELNDIFSDGAERYQRLTPPGYLDISKAGAADEFEFGGLVYRRQFGDLVIWNQLLSAAASAKLKYVVFLTDDEKDDWWWIVDSQGKKRIGPRPELVDEIRRRADTELFHMYNSEQFVRWSGEYLKVALQSESVEQIREIKEAIAGHDRIFEYRRLVERLVEQWVRAQHRKAVYPRKERPYPDILVVTPEGRRIGYQILSVSQRSPNLIPRLREVMLRAYYELHQQRMDELWRVLPGIDPAESERIMQAIREREGASLIDKVGVILGSIEEETDDTAAKFVPAHIVYPGKPAA